MTLTSFSFIAFLIILFILFYSAKGFLRLSVLLFASYVFYGLWDWKLLILLNITILCDYAVARALSAAERNRSRRLLLAISIFVNLGVLSLFKYLGFFVSILSWISQIVKVGNIQVDFAIVLPVSISFYIFKSLSYTIDVYFKRIQAEKNFLIYANCISFFPHILAGPIMRPRWFLPQFHSDAIIDYELFTRGVSRIVLGCFKKMVVADNLAYVVNAIFNMPTIYSSLQLVMGAVFYAFQIYCDFSGYSDIAIGIGNLFGFECHENFDHPYFSKSPKEFWRRWHISFSTWLRDYIFMPIFYPLSRYFLKKGFKEKTSDRLSYLTAIMITMLIAGLWHGPAWGFVLWGGLHGLALAMQNIYEYILKTKAKNKRSNSFRKKLLKNLFMFTFICLTWIFFRSQNISTAMVYLKGIFRFNKMEGLGQIISKFILFKGIILIIIFLIYEIVENSNYAKRISKERVKIRRLILCLVAVWTIAIFGVFNGGKFLYIRF